MKKEKKEESVRYVYIIATDEGGKATIPFCVPKSSLSGDQAKNYILDNGLHVLDGKLFVEVNTDD
tara:strand:- start:2525 stop:2719 length:195 start_codon:yes stop_codon:yes gene_type:complete